nr:copia protein [Tanacetum cinerariifolium]
IRNQTNLNAGFQDKLDAEKTGEEIDPQYMLFPVWSFGSSNPQNNDEDAAFDGKEHDFDVKKPESEVIFSPSNSAKSRKQDNKIKKEAKGKIPDESTTRYRNLNAEFEDCSDNSSNEVNAAGFIVPTFRQNSLDNTNTFSVAGPLNDVVSLTYGKYSFIDASQLPDDLDMPELEDITNSNDEDVVGAEADFNNLESSISDELLQFKMQKVWVLVNLSHRKRAIGTKWVYRNKKDERGIVVRNKARLVEQGHTQEVGINYEEVFAPVARIKDIRLFLAYASFMGFMMYQMDVKSAFLYETIKEEVYVYQPPGFEDPDHPDKVYKVVKVKKNKDGIFISQDIYVTKILRKFRLTKGKTASTPIDTEKPLLKDPDGEDVDVHTYMSTIGSLMYLTSSRPDIMFADSPFDLVAYSDSDYAGASLDRKSTTGGCATDSESTARLWSISAKRTSWNEFSLVMASVVICLSTGRKFNFSKYIFDSLVRNVDNTSKFYMYPRFIQLLIRKQIGDLSTHTTKYTSPALTQKVFANMRRVGKGFSRVETPLFERMFIGQGIEEGGDADEHFKVDITTQGDDTAAYREVPTVSQEPSIPSPTLPTPLPQPPQDLPSTLQQAADFPMSLLQEALNACAALTRRVEHLDYDKVAQAQEITKLKRRVKKLKKMNRVKVLKLRRIIDELDKDDAVALMDDKEEDKNDEEAMVVEDDQEDKPVEVHEVVDVVITAKLITELVTAASETVTAASTTISAAEPKVPAATITAAPVRVAASTRRRKRVVIRDPKEELTTSSIIPADTKSKDKEYARKLHAELNKDINWDEAIEHVKQKAKEGPAVQRYQVMKKRPQIEAQARKNMIMYLKNVAGFRLDYFKEMSYDDIRLIFQANFNSNIEFLLKTKEQMEEEENRAIQSINETPAQKAAKRKKLNEEVEDLKRHLEIVPDEDDNVYTEVTPLARKGTINLGLRYSKDTGMSLTEYANTDHAGCQDTRRITSGSAQFLGNKLVSWSSKKQKCTAISSTEAEYIALSGCYAQILWMRS